LNIVIVDYQVFSLSVCSIFLSHPILHYECCILYWVGFAYALEPTFHWVRSQPR